MSGTPKLSNYDYDEFILSEIFNNAVLAWEFVWDSYLTGTPAEAVTDAGIRESKGGKTQMIVHPYTLHTAVSNG